MSLPPEASKRRTNKFWLPYAWAVRVLVERGHGITESARAVLMKAGEDPTPEKVACLRVVYYTVRKLMWPPEYAHLRERWQPPSKASAESPRKMDQAPEIDDFVV